MVSEQDEVIKSALTKMAVDLSASLPGTGLGDALKTVLRERYGFSAEAAEWTRRDVIDVTASILPEAREHIFAVTRMETARVKAKRKKKAVEPEPEIDDDTADDPRADELEQDKEDDQDEPEVKKVKPNPKTASREGIEQYFHSQARQIQERSYGETPYAKAYTQVVSANAELYAIYAKIVRRA